MDISQPQSIFTFKHYKMLRADIIKIKEDPEWLQIKNVFPITKDDFSFDTEIDVDRDEFEKVINLINKTWKVTDFVFHYAVWRYERFIRYEVINGFIEILEEEESNMFFEAVSFLYNHYCRCVEIVTDIFALMKADGRHMKVTFEDNPEDAVRTKIAGTMGRLLKKEHIKKIQECYKYDLCLADNRNNISFTCPTCLKENCTECRENLMEASGKLKEMHVFQNTLHPTIFTVAVEHINSRIEEVCEGDLNKSYIDDLVKWVCTTVLKWMKTSCTLENCDDELKYFYSLSLGDHLYTAYTKIRIDQIFKIIIEYPDSLPVLEDIKECMSGTDLRSYFIKTLKSEMKTRLLHQGVGTSDILTAYVATIKALRVLDSSSQLLDAVTEPIHEYLRTRSDTIRCVVTSLTEEGQNDLADELVSGEVVQAEEEEDDWMKWVPPPKNPTPNESKTPSKSADIITMLINVYGSKELFVKEYRTLLADRLLSQLSCDTEREIRYLELLKLRFGDAQLNLCEVMLKDVVDSRRINQHIKENPSYNKEENFISAMIASAQFWPPFKEEKLVLHPNVVKSMQNFTSFFEALKGNRTLLWKNHLGVVDLEIESGNKILEFSVSPLLATILLFFQDNREWSLKQLSNKMMVTMTTLRSKISYWQSQGLITEVEPDLFVLEEDNVESVKVEADVEDYDIESAMPSARDQRNEELQTYWSYIVGMLTNLESLPLDRIHQMLKMFVYEETSTEFTVEDIQNFLDKKIREHQLILSNGVYKLPK